MKNFINHVAIRTPDLHRSIDFYVNVLDMKVSAIDNHYGDGGYKSIFVMDKEEKFEVEIIETGAHSGFEKGNCLDHFGVRALNRTDFNRAFIMAQKLNHVYQEAIAHHSHGRIYLIGWIMSPEKVKINIVYKTDENEKGGNGE